ncbi:hypothetical protein DL769_011277 [Monosporascus sp. CRB-8-3]|nr:hypothetical protein DL769_011277 [Monosporascus sp. CRB-8-3]
MKTSARHPVRLNGGVLRPRQGRIPRSRCGVLNPPSSKGPDKGSEPAEGFVAKFEEGEINGVLKIAIVNGVATFQLQWSLDLSCTEHRPGDRAVGSQLCKPPTKRSSPAKHHTSKSPLPGQTKDTLPTEINDQEEWEVQKILASRTHHEELQYRVKWVGWEDDQTWYYADGFKGSPYLLMQYHLDYPKMPGPPVRLEQWLRAYEDNIEDADHSDNNKPVSGGSD